MHKRIQAKKAREQHPLFLSAQELKEFFFSNLWSTCLNLCLLCLLSAWYRIEILPHLSLIFIQTILPLLLYIIIYRDQVSKKEMHVIFFFYSTNFQQFQLIISDFWDNNYIWSMYYSFSLICPLLLFFYYFSQVITWMTLKECVEISCPHSNKTDWKII